MFYTFNFFRTILKKIVIVILMFVFGSWVLARDIFAKIVINEVLNNPAGTEAGAEWVELYNTEDLPASVATCTLYLDANTQSQKVTFGSEDFIDKFKVVTWDSSWLNNSGDTVKVDCNTESDLVIYGDESGATVSIPDEGISFGRNPDGTGNFGILSSVTLGERNANFPTANPTATNTPTTITQSPTMTPKPTPTSKPIATVSPTATLQPTNTPKTTSFPISLVTSPAVTSSAFGSIEQIGEVEGIEDVNEHNLEVEAKKDSIVLKPESNNKKSQIPGIILIMAGTILIIFSLIPIIKTMKNKYNVIK